MDTFSIVLGFIAIGFCVWRIVDMIIEFKKDDIEIFKRQFVEKISKFAKKHKVENYEEDSEPFVKTFVKKIIAFKKPKNKDVSAKEEENDEKHKGLCNSILRSFCST